MARDRSVLFVNTVVQNVSKLRAGVVQVIDDRRVFNSILNLGVLSLLAYKRLDDSIVVGPEPSVDRRGLDV
eukprot:1365073-Amorphochlora_amoeboformis.AAC.1